MVILAKICTDKTAFTGPCRAAHKLWTFDKKEEICREFTYGGCLGNGNRFKSMAECEATCITMNNEKKKDKEKPNENKLDKDKKDDEKKGLKDTINNDKRNATFNFMKPWDLRELDFVNVLRARKLKG